MEFFIPFIFCRSVQFKRDKKGAFFGFCQDVCWSSAILFLYPNPILWFFLTLYTLLSWYLSFYLKIPLTPSLWKLALRPASFIDSIRPFFLPILGGFLLAGISLLGFRHMPDRWTWLGLFGVSGSLILYKRESIPVRVSKKESGGWAPFLGEKEFAISFAQKPHVIFLILESFRAKNVGCLGGFPALSPHFDRLAEKSILFTQFHSTSYLTSCCTIASLFGIPPAPVHGHLGEYLPLSLYGLPQIFRKENYHTALLQGGSLAFDHSFEFFQKQGFQTLIGKKEMGNVSSGSWGVHDEHLMRYASRWLKEQKEPTFMTLFTITNHHPWIAPNSKEGFLESFAYTDQALGLFLEELPSNSLLFVFGDHGQESRSGHFEINKSLYQENLHVPLLIHASGIEPKRIETPCSQIDLLPTLLDILDMPAFPHSLGRSLIRTGPSIPLFFSHPFDRNIRGCREENWKLLLDGDLAELYDLSQDPDERSNLASTHPEQVEKLKQLTDDYQASVEALYQTNRWVPEEIPSRELKIVDSLEWDDQALTQIDPRLSALSLKNCLLLTDAGFSQLFSQHTSLEKLTLQGLDITSEGWATLPHLMHVKITDCPRFQGKWLATLPSLRILQLVALGMTDEDLASIQGLWALHLSRMDQLSTGGLKSLFENNPYLTTLTLESSSQISDEVLRFLPKNALCRLSLLSLSQITDEGLAALAAFPLQHLILQNCPQITGATLSSIAAKGTHIFLSQCPNINSSYLGPKIWWDQQELHAYVQKGSA